MKASSLRMILYGGLALLFILAQVWFAWGNLQGTEETSALELAGMTAVNFLILSIPLLLLCGGVALLASAWQYHRETGHIQPGLVKWLYWAPRVAAILIIGFISLFSFDVFEGDAPVWQEIGGFIMHSLPSIVMAGFLWLAWRREWLGFWAFLAAAAVFLATVIGGGIHAIGNLLLFVLPLVVVALLFRVNWLWRDELRPHPTAPAA